MNRIRRNPNGQGFWHADTERSKVDQKLDEVVKRSAEKASARVAKSIAQRLGNRQKVVERA